MKIVKPNPDQFWDYMQKIASPNNVYCLHYNEGTSLFTSCISEYTWMNMESIDVVNQNLRVLVPSSVSLVS